MTHEGGSALADNNMASFFVFVGHYLRVRFDERNIPASHLLTINFFVFFATIIPRVDTKRFAAEWSIGALVCFGSTIHNGGQPVPDDDVSDFVTSFF